MGETTLKTHLAHLNIQQLPPKNRAHNTGKILIRYKGEKPAGGLRQKEKLPSECFVLLLAEIRVQWPKLLSSEKVKVSGLLFTRQYC